ncbi:hypothetical protein ACHAPJ_010482 [Fusarium lateritium]
MATSQSLPQLLVSGGNGEGLPSSDGSFSELSTESFLNQLPGGSSLRETFRELRKQLSHASHDLAPQDDILWKEHRKDLARLVWNHAIDRRKMRHETSWEAKEVGGRKVVYIGCKNSKAEKEVKRNLDDCGARDFVRQKLQFDKIEVNDEFTGHLAKTDLSTALLREPPYLKKRSLLGTPFEVTTSKDNSSITTLGGIVLVDGKPYALATGCPFSNDDVETMDRDEVIVYSYSGSGHPQQLRAARQIMRQRKESLHSSTSSDWALVALPEGEFPPNSMLDVEEKSLRGWPWPSTSRYLDLLVDKYVTEQDLEALTQSGKGRVVCLTYSSSSSSSGPIPGLLAPGTSTVMLSGTIFTVLRIDMFIPLGKAFPPFALP